MVAPRTPSRGSSESKPAPCTLHSRGRFPAASPPPPASEPEPCQCLRSTPSSPPPRLLRGRHLGEPVLDGFVKNRNSRVARRRGRRRDFPMGLFRKNRAQVIRRGGGERAVEERTTRRVGGSTVEIRRVTEG